MEPTNRRRYFTEQELAKLISAARKGRYGQRDGWPALRSPPHAAPYMRTSACRCWPRYAEASVLVGHADIKHTAHYSELSAMPFKDFWKS